MIRSFILVFLFVVAVGNTGFSQAKTYQTAYKVFSATLSDQPGIRSVLEKDPLYQSLPSFEQEFIYYLNYVRRYPMVFAKQAVEPYLATYPEFKPVYGQSLLTDLAKGDTSRLLLPDSKLVKLARAHAADISAHDFMSHNSFNGTQMQKRFEQGGVICGSECINLLSSGSALEVLLSLLVDYQVQNFGHRKSLLAERMVAVGVGKGVSKKGLQYTVIDLSCD